MRRRLGALVLVGGVLLGGGAAGCSVLGGGPAAASPATRSTSPATPPDERRASAPASDAPPAESRDRELYLTKDMASRPSGDGYSFGHDFAMRTWSEGDDVVPALVCSTASEKYVEGELGG